MRNRKRRHEEHENHERWLVSYADFITLLFAFFVVMYAVSSVNDGKMRVLSDSLVATFTSREKSLSPIQVGELVRSKYGERFSPITKPLARPPEKGSEGEARGPGGQRNDGASESQGGGFSGQDTDQMADIDSVADQVEADLASLIDDELVEVRRKDDWLEIEFKNNLLFPSGNARVSAGARGVLGDLAGFLQEFPNPVQVEGFTDNVPIRTAAFPSNWQLSAARAASVVSVFADAGVKPERLSAIGYGEHRPIADNATAEGRKKNRRVVLIIPAKPDDRHLTELNRMAELPDAGSVEVPDDSGDASDEVQPWAEAPADYSYTRD